MTYLFIWLALAGAGSGGSSYGSYREMRFEYGWVNAGIFDSPTACHKAAANLGLDATKHRCIWKETGEAK